MRTAAVVGTGLIGTSVGLALTRHGVGVHLSDLDGTAARTAAALGAGTVAAPAGPVDLAVLAVPPSLVGSVLTEQQERGLARSYTDVASVKSVTRQAILAGAVDPGSYIGGHPLAGRERSGPLGASADLFEGRSWVLTPGPETSRTTLNRTLELVSACGAVPVVMESEAHDRAVALTSHVPHLVASAMAARLPGAPKDALRLVGQGLRDVTRIAGGDALLWSDILRSNAAAVADVLGDLLKDLDAVEGALRSLAVLDGGPGSPDTAAVADLLARGRTGWEDIRARPGGRPAQPLTVRVVIGDRPGELARLLDAVADFGIGVEEMEVRPVPEAAGDTALGADIGVAAAVADPVRRRLAEGGWNARIARPEPAATAGTGGATTRPEPLSPPAGAANSAAAHARTT
ncbi:prephenate dehydrogenase [Streptomyces sp. SP18CS02]|uniref:prephenate dehydrogenase n=1 Tax=Streptomyces sp. SP18CS02 TaxID=3002531 RepID=UPI003FCCEB87